MALKLADIFERLWNYLIVEDGVVKAKEEDEQDLLDAVEQARGEWLAAKAYFDSVTDPDLIEHAIYSIKASERKYAYLIKRASSLGYGVAPAQARQDERDREVGRDDSEDCPAENVDPVPAENSASAVSDNSGAVDGSSGEARDEQSQVAVYGNSASGRAESYTGAPDEGSGRAEVEGSEEDRDENRGDVPDRDLDATRDKDFRDAGEEASEGGRDRETAAQGAV